MFTRFNKLDESYRTSSDKIKEILINEVINKSNYNYENYIQGEEDYQFIKIHTYEHTFHTLLIDGKYTGKGFYVDSITDRYDHINIDNLSLRFRKENKKEILLNELYKVRETCKEVRLLINEEIEIFKCEECINGIINEIKFLYDINLYFIHEDKTINGYEII